MPEDKSTGAGSPSHEATPLHSGKGNSASASERSLPSAGGIGSGSAAESPRSAGVSQRLMSLDALRGFDMFWIIGAEDLFHGLNKISNTGAFRVITGQLDHEDWEGVHFYDLIFPLFVFIVGASIVFSLSRMIDQVGKAATLRRVLIRSLVLYCFGLLVYGGISEGFDHVRGMGVVQRIAFS